MTILWGANYAIVKAAIREVPAHAFNALRLVIASALFIAALWSRGPSRVPGGDWLRLAALGFVGHLVYQVCFMGGLARTSVANGSLIIGSTPIAVSLLTAAAGHERLGRAHWIGTLCSLGGIYLIVARGGATGGASLTGDLLFMAAVVCWTIYTVGSRPLLGRYSPLAVTGYTMAFGTLFYFPVALSDLRALDWASVSAGAWAAIVYSAVASLCVAYLIWYTAVQRIGNARTSIYSNMVPMAALIVAVIWLREPVAPMKLAGAAAILGGVLLTRLDRARPVQPPEE
jgi:drug/metabolite transporter (DMT)-like permease